MSDFTSPADIVTALAAAMTVGARQFGIKNSITTLIANYYSAWRCAGQPGIGSVPTAWESPTDATPGSWVPSLVDPSGGKTNRLLQWSATYGSACTMIWGDRVGHMGGLSGVLTTAQTVGGTLTAPAAAGRCQANGSDVTWFLEWYTATGATAVTATVNVTYSDLSTGDIAISLAASIPAYRLIPITPTNGLNIIGVNTVTLSASTATAGSFGVTAWTYLDAAYSLSNALVTRDWAQCGMPKIGTGACIVPYALMAGSSFGGVQYSFIVGAA